MLSKKVLVITPAFYYPPRGADDIDRVEGIRQLLRLGAQVRVMTRNFDFHRPHLEAAREGLGVKITSVPYRQTTTTSWKRIVNQCGERMLHPTVLDGSALDFKNGQVLDVLSHALDSWKPDAMLADGTYAWPVVHLANRRGIPAVTRSLNFEPTHVLEENRHTVPAILRSMVRWPSELRAAQKSDAVMAISPKEAGIYRRLGARRVLNLPLRGLPGVLREPVMVKDKAVLDAFFMGSTFNVEHMSAALKYLLREVVPLANEKLPEALRFHIFGGKAPAALVSALPPNVHYHGYVADLGSHLRNMDIALAPSLFGAGMQQKVFEPICRGIPTITHPRALVGYPFQSGRHVLLASSPHDFVLCLSQLRDLGVRRDLAKRSTQLARKLFDQVTLDRVVLSALEES